MVAIVHCKKSIASHRVLRVTCVGVIIDSGKGRSFAIAMVVGAVLIVDAVDK